MFTRKFYDVPVYLWVILLCLLGYLLYTKLYKSEHMSNAKANNTDTGYTNKSEDVDTTNDLKLYNFNTSWCGHSVRFQDEWNKFANEIAKKNNVLPVKVYDIKCDNVANQSMCEDYEIPGFPSVVIEKNGKRELYNGPRTADALLETVEHKL